MSFATYTVTLDLDPDIDTGGNEVGYAQATGMQTTTGTALVDVTGLTVTFVAGTRPLSFSLETELTNSVAAGETKAYIVLDGTVIGWISEPAAAMKWRQHSRTVRKSLTPGTTHTVKVQLACTSGGGTAYLGGDPSSPASLTVLTR